MLHSAGKDPLTWSSAKLFARHVAQQLHAFEGVPGSHAWRWQRGGLWRARLLTKAQVVGVLVSVHERAERVEFLVDDGTALVKAVRWSAAGWDRRVALGDLVLVQGKLSMDRTPGGGGGEREIRVAHIARVADPNEELLHWVHVMELARDVYSADAPAPTTPTDLAPSRPSRWKQIAAHAFFELAVDAQAKTHFLARAGAEPHDELLVGTLEALVHEQTQQLSGGAVRVTFVAALARLSQPPDARAVRSLRRAFAALRSAGLLFLEDADTDRHALLSFELALKPALLRRLRGADGGLSAAELTEWAVSQRAFRRLPLRWLEAALQRLLRAGLVSQRADSQRFHAADADVDADAQHQPHVAGATSR